MEIIGECLDAVLIDLYKSMLLNGETNKAGRGTTTEMLGVALRLSNPRARLSRSEDRGKPFSAIGELLWYLSKSDKLDFIQPYVPAYVQDAEEGRLYGAYGPRLFSMRGSIDQVANVIKLLSESPGSRRAVIQLFNAEDIEVRYPEIPCTTSLQFHVRNQKLHMSVTMRSNDAYWGLPHDVFCFTMLQEMMARKLALDIGEYYHYAGSMHVYEDYIPAMKAYVEEGYQKMIEMPPMPEGDQFECAAEILRAEDEIRHGGKVVAADFANSDYWGDIIRLVQIFWASGQKKPLDLLRDELVNPNYKTYVEGRRNMKVKEPKTRGTALGGQ